MSLEVGTLRALAHPVRLRMLSLLTGTAMSATEVAAELGVSQANASYHLRALAGAGYLVVDSEERIRGGVAKRYRHPWEQDSSERPPTEDFLLYIQAMTSELSRRALHRDPSIRPATQTDAELWVEPQVWAEVAALVEEASGKLHAAAKPPRTTGTVHVNMSASLFAMTEDEPS